MVASLHRAGLGLFTTLSVFAIIFAAASRATADPPDLLRNYRFIPADTKVHVSGGAQDYNLNLTIAGRFGLVTGYDEQPSPTAGIPTLVPHAEFIDVHGILFNPLSLAPLPLPGWDLDKTLNLSGLRGTFSVGQPNQLYFLGADGQGVALRLEADIAGPWLHLTGGSSDPVGSKPVLYSINALAHLGPFPDFNGDAALTAADVPPMLEMLTDPTAYAAAHQMSLDDLTALADTTGDGQLTNDDLQAFLYQLARTTNAAPDFSAFANSSVGATVAVPEPNALVIAFLGFCLFGAAMLLSRRVPLASPALFAERKQGNQTGH